MTKKLSNNQSLLRGFIEREFNRSDYTRVSDYFEFFAADKTLKEDELSADDINLGLMGRSGDGGCDGAYLFCNSELGKRVERFIKGSDLPRGDQNDILFAINYNMLFVRMVKKYNKHHKDSPLPHITPHTLRHTFCTRLASKNMNPKDLQYIMGHSNISITMNWYAHASIDTAKSEVQRLIA